MPRDRRARVAEIERGLQEFGDYLASFERLAPSTVVTYVRQCRLVFQGLPHAGDTSWPVDIAVGELRDFMRREALRGFTSSTLRNRLLSLSAYYRFLHHIGYTIESPLHSVRPPRPGRLEAEFYSVEDVERILTYAFSSANTREPLGGVVLATFNYTGLRLDELVKLRRDQVDLRNRRLRVVGKRSRSRTVPIPHVLVDVLDDYLTGLRATLAASPFVFVNPRSQPDGPYRGVIQGQAVERLVKQVGRAAGVPGRHHPHKWRHTYATQLLRNGVNIYMIQRLLGHASITTTAIYLHVVDDDLRAALDDVFPPRRPTTISPRVEVQVDDRDELREELAIAGGQLRHILAQRRPESGVI